MEFLIGILLALAVAIFATCTGFDRDRSFYPVVLIIVASTYEIFALMYGSAQIFGQESIAFLLFLVAAVVGFRTNLWIVVAALAGHGLFDLVHPHVITNPGVPAGWPEFCMSYDIVAAVYMGWRLTLPHAIRPAGMQLQAGENV